MTAGCDRGQALSLYRTMLIIRLTEEQLRAAHQRGLIHGACHTYVGQEAIAAGVCAHLRPDDVVFSTHRGHGHALAKGVEPARAHGRAARPRDGLLARARRQHAPVRARDRHDGHQRHRRPLHPAGRGRGLQLQAARRRTAWPWPSSATAPSTTARSTRGSTWPPSGSCRCCSSARTTSTPRKCPFRYAGGNPDVAARGRGLRHARRSRRRQRRAGGLPRGRRGGAAGAPRRGADADRVQDLPHAAARRRHGRLHLPHARRSRGVEGALPDRAALRKRLLEDRHRDRGASWRPSRSEVGGRHEWPHAFAETERRPAGRQPATRHVYARLRRNPPPVTRRHRPPATRADHLHRRPRSKRSPRRWPATRRSS